MIKILNSLVSTNKFSFLNQRKSFSSLPQFSVYKIHYVHDFIYKSLDLKNQNITFLHLRSLHGDIKKLLELLDSNHNYWVSLKIARSINHWKLYEGFQVFLDNPILLNFESCPVLLDKYINNRINLLINEYKIDESLFITHETIIIVDYIKIDLL